MAFFTVEDAGGVMECLAFPKTFTQFGEIIKPDNAVFVEGNLSVREEESPKILVSVMGLLVDNDHFNGSVKATPVPTPKPQQPAAEQRSAPAQKAAYNPYDSMPATQPQRQATEQKPATERQPMYNPYESMPASKPAPIPPFTPPQKIYLRVPDREGETYRKALNLCEAFRDGTTSVIFYDMKEGKYYASNLKMRVTPFVLTRLENVLGKENVVAK